MRRGIAALANRDLLQGFNTWAERASEAAEEKRRMRSSLAALQGSGTRRAWMSWSSNARDRHKLIIAARRIVMRNMLQALSTWKAIAESIAERKRRMQRAISSLSPEGQARRKAFNAWIEMAHERAALLRAASAIIRRSEFVAFGTWLDAATELLERRMMLHRSASALINRSLRTALNAWVVRADEIADDKRRMRASLSALVGKPTSVVNMGCCLRRAKRREQQVKQALSVYLLKVGRAARLLIMDDNEKQRTRMRRNI